MIYNYHTHTYRCGHAVGKEEEYIKRAIEMGVKYMGFSEHFPLKFSDGTQSGYRLAVENIEDYVNQINVLREKYKDQIEIKLGFEMEYYKELFDEMLNNAIKYGAEYLILGEHYICPENSGAEAATRETYDEEKLEAYTNCVVEAIETKKYTYVAHPDIINFKGDREKLEEAYRQICIASRETNIPLELNFLGIRGNRNYPNELFFKIAGEEKSPITFGFDAHSKAEAYDGKSLIKAKEWVLRYKLNYIGKPKLMPLE